MNVSEGRIQMKKSFFRLASLLDCEVLQEESYNTRTMSSLTKFLLNKIYIFFYISLDSQNYRMNHTWPDIFLNPRIFFLIAKITV